MGWFAADLVRQMTLPGAVLAVLGVGALARGGGLAAGAAAAGSGGLAGAASAGSSGLVLLGNSVVLIALLGFDFDPFWLAVFRPYPLVCYGVAALWVAAGLQWAMDRLAGWTARSRWAPAARRLTGRPAGGQTDASVEGTTRVGGASRAGGTPIALGEGTDGTIDLTRDERGERHFLELLDRRPADGWERSRRNGLLTHYGTYLGLVVLSGSPLLLEPMAGLFERADDCYPCLLGMAGSLLGNDAAGPAGRIAGWLARAEALRGRPEQAGVSQGLLRAGSPGRADRRHRRRGRTLPAGLCRLSAPGGRRGGGAEAARAAPRGPRQSC